MLFGSCRYLDFWNFSSEKCEKAVFVANCIHYFPFFFSDFPSAFARTEIEIL